MTDPLFTSGDDTVERGLDELRSFKKYPFSDEIDRQFVRRLIDENPTVDVPFELRKWVLWMSEHTSTRKVRHRARIETWVRRAATYRRRPPAGASVSGTAEAATDHAATSDGLEQW